MTDARLLPRVGDRDDVDGEPVNVLIVEDDPAVLDAYARGLWQHWQALSGGAPAKGYTKTMVKAAVVWLTDAYASAEAPIPNELSRLVRAIVTGKLKKLDPGTSDVENASTSPVRASSEKAYWAAIQFEARHPETAPATVYKIAQHLCDGRMLLNKDSSQDSAKGIVRDWRKLAHYKANVELYRKLYRMKP